MARTLRLASPEQIRAGFWDRCPHCGEPVYMPIAGSKDAKAPVRCPACQGAIQPEC